MRHPKRAPNHGRLKPVRDAIGQTEGDLVTRVDTVVRDSWLAWVIAWWGLAVWMRHKKTVKAERLGPMLARVLLPFLTCLAVIFLINWLRPDLLQSPFASPRPEALIAVGLSFLYLGFACMFWARFTLGRNWSGRVTLKEDHELVNRGPYRFVRHPIYTGLILAIVGTAVVRANVVWLLVAAALTWGIVIKARLEESYMLENFGVRYQEYRARTGFLVPRLHTRP